MERTDLRSQAEYRDHFPERLLRAKPVSAVRMLGVGSLKLERTEADGATLSKVELKEIRRPWSTRNSEKVFS